MKTDSPIHVLVADLAPMFRYGLTALAENTPDLHLVGTAYGAEGVIQAIKTTKPEVVILGVRPPQMEGLSIISEVQSLPKPPYFLAVLPPDFSGYSDGVFLAGARGYVLGDVEPSELLRAIRLIAQGQVALDASSTAHLLQRLARTEPTDALSPRERDVLRLMVSGDSNKMIARRLSVSEHTVRSHVSHILHKLNVQSRGAAVVMALKHGLAPLESIEL